jgi:hypothetical protein
MLPATAKIKKGQRAILLLIENPSFSRKQKSPQETSLSGGFDGPPFGILFSWFALKG